MTLDKWLTDNGYTAQAFADKIGVSVHTVQAYRNGLRRPRPDTMARITRTTKGQVAYADLTRVYKKVHKDA
jgi:transcriptional regulator with XRE-family HTH domain